MKYILIKYAHDNSHNGWDDVFVTKLSSSGNLVYSTFIGGSDDDIGSGITVDSAGAVYVTGNTDSSDFLTKNASDTSRNGDEDVFVTSLYPNGMMQDSITLDKTETDFGEIVVSRTS